MPNISKILIVFTVILISGKTFAQDSIPSKYEFIKFGLQPLYFFKGGFRVDAEYVTKNQKHGIQISPILYYNEKNAQTSYNSSINNKKYIIEGFAVVLTHKIYMSKFKNNKGMSYVGYSGEYATYKVTLNENISEQKIENIKSGTLELITGFQFFPGVFFMDTYIGVGGQYSQIKIDNPDILPVFNKKKSDYGFTGVKIQFGLKFGFVFSR